MPRVVNVVYCKHDNPACQNDYDSSLGVITRHNLTEFPPSQYLIDPALSPGPSDEAPTLRYPGGGGE